MRYPIKDKFWGWRIDPFEVFAYWDSRRISPNWHWHWHWPPNWAWPVSHARKIVARVTCTVFSLC